MHIGNPLPALLFFFPLVTQKLINFRFTTQKSSKDRSFEMEVGKNWHQDFFGVAFIGVFSPFGSILALYEALSVSIWKFYN